MKLVLAFAFVVCAWGQTTVTDTIHTAGGGLATGTLYITPSAQFASGSNQVYQVPIPVTLNNSGVFTVTLYPNDTGVPASTYYIVQWSLDGPPGYPGQSPTEFWVVPTSGTPVGLAGVRSSPQSLPLPSISPSQITCSGCVTGASLVWSGTSWGPSIGGRTFAFTLQTSVTCTHNLNSIFIGVSVVDAFGNTIIPALVQRISATVVVVTFDAATTGTVRVE